MVASEWEGEVRRANRSTVTLEHNENLMNTVVIFLLFPVASGMSTQNLTQLGFLCPHDFLGPSFYWTGPQADIPQLHFYLMVKFQTFFHHIKPHENKRLTLYFLRVHASGITQL